MSMAAPGGREPRAALVEHREHPGNEHALGCPNCRQSDSLVVDVPMTVHHRITAFGVPGISDPLIDVTESDQIDSNATPIEPVTAVRCLNCRWAYRGEFPLRKLVEVES